MDVEALVRHLAHNKCFDAEIEGYGFDTENPEDIEHFMDSAREEAQVYLDILGVHADFTIEDFEAGQRAALGGMTAVEALIEARTQLEKVEALHYPVMEDGVAVGCVVCEWEVGDNSTWPCETARAVRGV